MAGQRIAVMFPASILTKTEEFYNVRIYNLSVSVCGPVPCVVSNRRCGLLVQRQSVRRCAA